MSAVCCDRDPDLDAVARFMSDVNHLGNNYRRIGCGARNATEGRQPYSRISARSRAGDVHRSKLVLGREIAGAGSKPAPRAPYAVRERCAAFRSNVFAIVMPTGGGRA
jgi:hypothetical protein